MDISNHSLFLSTVDEPKLSYERILNDLPIQVKDDIITSSCIHNKLFAIGTNSGKIHVFDHQGNKVNRQDISVHLKAVRCISIDKKGEYFVSCSDDKLAVYGLCNNEHNFVVLPDKTVNCVAIDPYFYKSGNGRRFVAGDDRLTLYERGFLARYKTVQIQARREQVLNVSWNGQFIAWVTNFEVRIYDIEQRVVITKIKKDLQSDIECPDLGLSSFSWKDERTLLLAWNRLVRICSIKDRPSESLFESTLKELPKKYVEIVSMFSTDFYIYGLAPFEKTILTLSITEPCEDPHNPIAELVRPRLHILECSPDSYCELSSDVVTPNGSHTSSKWNYCYNLVSLHKESIYFIICPKDVILAKPRDQDDHVDWLLQHSMLKEAYLYSRDNSHKLQRNSLKDIEDKYIKELRENIVNLMETNGDETAQILVDNIDYISVREVMQRLQKLPKLLLLYLHRLALKNPDSCIDYHDLMLKLYAKYKRESLLSFLKQSTNYKLEEALTICQEHGLIKEVVYLYGRMGNLRTALKYIIESQGDIHEAIEFCKEHQDSDLWQDLISYSMSKPEFISVLLKNVGTYIDDPMNLIEKIPRGCDIDGLMPALVKILQDYKLQISLEQSCRDIIAADCFELLEKQMRRQSQSIVIDENQACDHCSQSIYNPTTTTNQLQQSSASSVLSRHLQTNFDGSKALVDGENSANIVVFGCHHVYHEECAGSDLTADNELNNRMLVCRICMHDSEDV